MPDELNLSNLKPAQARKDRKRIGRGQGSGKGRYSGRGLKGQKSRSGSHKMRPGFEGGQNPIYMRLGKQRGPYSKDAMPMGPHRTHTQPVNVAALEERFDAGAEVTLEALIEKGLIKNTKIDVKLLGQGDLSKKLSVTVHAASTFSRALAEAAWTVMLSVFFRSPWPSSFTSVRVFLIRPFSTSASSVTSAPASKRSSSAATFTGCVEVRCGPIGIASAEYGPRCLPSRM